MGRRRYCRRLLGKLMRLHYSCRCSSQISPAGGGDPAFFILCRYTTLSFYADVSPKGDSAFYHKSILQICGHYAILPIRCKADGDAAPQRPRLRRETLRERLLAVCAFFRGLLCFFVVFGYPEFDYSFYQFVRNGFVERELYRPFALFVLGKFILEFAVS